MEELRLSDVDGIEDDPQAVLRRTSRLWNFEIDLPVNAPSQRSRCKKSYVQHSCRIFVKTSRTPGLENLQDIEVCVFKEKLKFLNRVT